MEKILIVEDDPMLIEIYQKKFSNDGYEVITATTGAEVLKKIKSDKPELVLLDLVLPEEDGFDVLKKIKKNSQTRDVRVIIFSNLSQAEDKQKATTLGAEGFITKSDFTPKEMINEVRKIFKRKSQPQEETVSVMEDSDGKINQVNVMLVENEEVFSEVFGEKLRNAGYAVDVVKADTWDCGDKKYDIFVVDVSMLDDIAKIGKMKKTCGSADSKILAIKNEEDDLGEFKQYADKILIKMKVTPSELLDEVNDLVK